MKYRVTAAAAALVLLCTGAVSTGPAWALSIQAPRDVTAAAGSTGGTATVRWAAPQAPTGLAGYTVVTLKDDGSELVAARANAPASSLGPITVSGLTNGSDYTFVVYARYASGNVASDASTKVTPYTFPAKPAKPTAERKGAGSVRLSWKAPDSGGSDILSYTVACTPSCTGATVTDLFADLTNLTSTTAYTFTVKATNARGASDVSDASDAVTPYDVPGAPRSVTGTAGDASIVVSWTAPESNGGSAVTGYLATASPGSTTCEPVSGQLTCIITGLTNGSTYSVSVVATNAAGSGAAGQATNVMPVAVPGKPTSVTVTAGDARATVSWTAPASDGGSAITSYRVTSSPESRTCTTSSLSCEVTGLTNGTSYTFTVRATNAIGSGLDSEPSGAATPSRSVSAPGAPVSVSASTGSAVGSILVSWSAPSSNGGAPITAYAVATAPTASGPWTLASDGVAPAVRSFTVTALSAGASYFVRVAAINSSGTGSWAVTGSATQAKPDPTPGPVVPPGPGPGPGPGPNPSESATASPSASPSPSSSPSPSASPSPSPSPSGSRSPSPTPTPQPSGSASLSRVDGPPDVVPRLPSRPSRRIGDSPSVTVNVGDAFAVRVPGLRPESRQVAAVLVEARWKRLATVRADERGQVRLPTLESTVPAVFVIRLAEPSRPPAYLRVVVTGRRRWTQTPRLPGH